MAMAKTMAATVTRNRGAMPTAVMTESMDSTTSTNAIGRA